MNNPRAIAGQLSCKCQQAVPCARAVHYYRFSGIGGNGGLAQKYLFLDFECGAAAAVEPAFAHSDDFQAVLW